VNTAFEALMKAMLLHGWFSKSGGSDESPLGFYGYVTNTKAELNEVFDAFADVVKAYGYPAEKDMVGSFFAHINSDGVIHIYRQDSDAAARRQYELHNIEYSEWLSK
jgi:hypothetical protein